MEFSNKDYVTPDEIIADTVLFVDDEEFRLASKGFYISQIQQALQELSFDTFFDKKADAFDIPENLRLEMPLGMFNIRQMYLFNGDKCDIANAQNIYHKRNFINGGRSGSVSRSKSNSSGDLFHASRGSDSSVYYYNIHNGYIMFSSNCSSYQKIFIDYNGTGGAVGEQPIIPLYLREAVKGFVVDISLKLRIAKSKKAEELNKWKTLWSMNDNTFSDPYDGSWAKAKKRVNAMGSKSKEDLTEYLRRFNH